MKLLAKLLSILLLGLVAASFPDVTGAQKVSLSFEEALEVIQKGLGSSDVTDREAAKDDPERVEPFKELRVKEITRLDASCGDG